MLSVQQAMLSFRVIIKLNQLNWVEAGAELGKSNSKCSGHSAFCSMILFCNLGVGGDVWFCRNVLPTISAHVDGGVSRGSRMCRPGSEDPHWRRAEIFKTDSPRRIIPFNNGNNNFVWTFEFRQNSLFYLECNLEIYVSIEFFLFT